MDKREFIRSIKDYLGLDSFQAVGVGASSVSLVKGNIQIGIGYYKIPGGYRLPPQIGGTKCFFKVEDLLEKYYLKHKINDSRKTIHCSSRRHEELSLIDLYSKKDIELVGTQLKSMVYDDILPFFEKYETLEDVHEHILDLEIGGYAVSNFITNPPHPRVMVIKRLVNANDWDSYCMETIKMYKEQSEGKYKAVFEPIYRFLPDLYNELKEYDNGS